MYKFLDKIESPSDLKKMNKNDIPELCSEIRDFLVKNVERQGGHLASNLGVTELTVALHRVFDSPNDKIVFDVGHQSYVHKILTGRKAAFSTLREAGGLSGFTSIKESEHDAFGAGHSTTSISAALGFAEAEKLNKSGAYSVAVIGDGAYTGGMAHEALNNCNPDLKMIIILNENGMSISLNKGTFASYLTKVRTSKRYRGFKSGTKSFLSHIPLLGKPTARALNYLKNKIKNLFLSPNYFEDLGLYYIGPIDGNDYKAVEKALLLAKETERCVVVHVKTVKGKGYLPAENDPGEFHSLKCGKNSDDSFHGEFAKELISLAGKDEKIVAVTAAMGVGTGLNAFGDTYPERYYDVGIAEEHALTFSAGLAAGGYKPFVAIYSTFLQRGYDNIIHDICLQNLPVRIMIDRASLAKSDGATHHGIFDVAFLSHIPNITILAPITYGSLKAAMQEAVDATSPIAIRYPNAAESGTVTDAFYKDENYNTFGAKKNYDGKPEYLFVTYGKITKEVLNADDELRKLGYKSGVILLERLKPYDKIAREIAEDALSAKSVLFVEEGIRNGGAGMLLLNEFISIDASIASKYKIAAIEDNFASPDRKCELYEYLGLSAGQLRKKILDLPLEK